MTFFLFVFVGALLLVVLSRIVMKNRLSKFLDNYRLISMGMTKQQVIEILGNQYTQCANMDGETLFESLSWSCRAKMAIQREFYYKKEEKIVVTVDFSNNRVIGYELEEGR